MPAVTTLSERQQIALDYVRFKSARGGSATASALASRQGDYDGRAWSRVLVGLARRGLIRSHKDSFVNQTFYTTTEESG